LIGHDFKSPLAAQVAKPASREKDATSVLFSILGTVVLLRAPLDRTLAVIWWIYTLSNVAMIGFSAYVLWRGGI
jgi:hypothetical protein